MIEEYLAELDRRLPRLLWRRRRVLAEVEAHLREAAAESSGGDAVARFGAASEVAADFRAGHAARVALLAVLGLLAYPVLSYPVIENSLPPAPWRGDHPPGYLDWKQDAMLYVFLVAVPLALAALVLLRRSRTVALALGALAVAAMAANAVLGIVVGAQWADAVPRTPAWLIAVPVLEVVLATWVGVLVARARALG